MAMDFPASPTNGQTYTYAGITYTWNGYGWIGGALGSAGVISDAPADGNDYVRVNNVWRMVKQTLTPAAGASTVDVAVPSWASMVDIDGSCYCNGAPVMQMRVSADGTTFLAGATDYNSAGPYHVGVTPGTFGGQLVASAAVMTITNVNDVIGSPIIFRISMNVARNTVSQHYTNKGYSMVYNMAQQFVTGWQHANTVPATGLRLAALRFLTTTTFIAGSQIHLRWL